MDSHSSGETSEPKRLKTLAFEVKHSDGNNLLHQFVVDNSDSNNPVSENYITAVLRSMTGTYINTLNDCGYSALHLAVLKNNLLMVKRLLSCFVDIDVDKRSNGQHNGYKTALYFASILGNSSIIQELLNKGANVNLKNGSKQIAALSWVAKTSHLEIMELLLNNGADIHVTDYCGQTPLHYAAEEGNLAAVEFLIVKGVDVNMKDNCNITPLHRAISKNRIKMVELLISKGACMNAKSKDITPLHLAACKDRIEIVEILIRNGANVNAKNLDGETPLHTAVFKKRINIVEILVRNGANVNAKNYQNETPLHMVVHSPVSTKEITFYEILGWNTTNLSAEDKNNKISLCDALVQRKKIINILVSNGANLNAKNNDGKTPLNLAEESGNQLCIDALRIVR